METFAEVRHHMLQTHELRIDEPFIVSFEYRFKESGRRQSMFLAELKTDDGRRVLRVETPIAPLSDLAAEKCLRLNLTLRVGYLAVGDLDSVPYIKMCENLPYAFLGEEELDYVIQHIAGSADEMEQFLKAGDDIT